MAAQFFLADERRCIAVSVDAEVGEGDEALVLCARRRSSRRVVRLECEKKLHEHEERCGDAGELQGGAHLLAAVLAPRKGSVMKCGLRFRMLVLHFRLLLRRWRLLLRRWRLLLRRLLRFLLLRRHWRLLRRLLRFRRELCCRRWLCCRLPLLPGRGLHRRLRCRRRLRRGLCCRRLFLRLRRRRLYRRLRCRWRLRRGLYWRRHLRRCSKRHDGNPLRTPLHVGHAHQKRHALHARHTTHIRHIRQARRKLRPAIGSGRLHIRHIQRLHIERRPLRRRRYPLPMRRDALPGGRRTFCRGRSVLYRQRLLCSRSFLSGGDRLSCCLRLLGSCQSLPQAHKYTFLFHAAFTPVLSGEEPPFFPFCSFLLSAAMSASVMRVPHVVFQNVTQATGICHRSTAS